jgi:hypothetical protein
MSAIILSIGIGFLLAVLWIDIIFDSMVLPHRDTKEPLPQEVLETMTRFFHRLTDKPRLIFVIMSTMLAIIILQIVQSSVPAWAGWSSLILFLTPTGFAAIRVIPTAQRLGSRKDTIEKQSELARSLIGMHTFCLILMVLLAGIQLYAAWIG